MVLSTSAVLPPWDIWQCLEETFLVVMMYGGCYWPLVGGGQHVPKLTMHRTAHIKEVSRAKCQCAELEEPCPLGTWLYFYPRTQAIWKAHLKNSSGSLSFRDLGCTLVDVCSLGPPLTELGEPGMVVVVSGGQEEKFQRGMTGQGGSRPQMSRSR